MIGGKPVRSLSEALPSLAIMAAFVGFLVLLAVKLDITEMFGLSVRWGWSAVDSGHARHVALTPKIADVRAPAAFMVPGEELEVDIDFQIEAGRARAAIYDEGWFRGGWPGFDEFFTLHRESGIRSPRTKTVRVAASRPGVYTVDGRIIDATGTFALDWRVVNPRTMGRIVRTVRFAVFSLPGFILLILLPIVIGALLWGRRD